MYCGRIAHSDNAANIAVQVITEIDLTVVIAKSTLPSSSVPSPATVASKLPDTAFRINPNMQGIHQYLSLNTANRLLVMHKAVGQFACRKKLPDLRNRRDRVERYDYC